MPSHDDVIKRKHYPRYWLFVPGIHRSPVNSPHKGQWRGALMFSLICAWTNGWASNRDDGDLRRHRTHYDVTVMFLWNWQPVRSITTTQPLQMISRVGWSRDSGSSGQRLSDVSQSNTPHTFSEWWRHDMGTLCALLDLCEGNPPVTVGFLSQRASHAMFWCFLLLWTLTSIWASCWWFDIRIWLISDLCDLILEYDWYLTFVIWY